MGGRWRLLLLLLILFHGHLMHSAGVAEGVTVLRFQEDRVARGDTLAVYSGQLDPARHFLSLTLCARFFLFTLHSRATFFSLLNDTGQADMLDGELWVEKVRPVLTKNWNFQLLKEPLWLSRWHHLCFTYDHQRHLISTYVDGRLSSQQEYDVGASFSGSRAVLGQGATPNRSFSGDLSQVNVWDRTLDAEEIQRMARCEDDPQGNYLSWVVGWTLQGVKSYEVPLPDFCKTDFDFIYWFPSLSHKESQYLCPALGSRHPSVTSREEIKALLQKADVRFPQDHSCYSEYWTTITDTQEESVWRDGKLRVDGTVDWAQQEPNGIEYENCASVNQNGVMDVNCNTNSKCVACFFDGLRRFSLLGTCELELRNVYFMVVQPKVGELQFLGYGAYQVMQREGTWVWLNVVTNQTIATMEKTKLDFPMGRRWWRLKRSVCGQEVGGWRRLLLSPCPPGYFTCDDATCINLATRCDLKYDCNDNSDELDCQVVAFPEDYQNHLPPRVEQEEKETSLPVTLSVSVESLGVDTLAMTLEVSYTLALTWVDNRLQYRNLKVNSTLNVLSATTMRLLWMPEVSFVNTVNGRRTVMDDDTTIRIERRRDAIGRNDSASAEEDVFSGEENTITSERKYGTVFTCYLELGLYPFDVQDCYMRFRITSASKSFLEINLNSSTVANFANELLVEYTVGHLSLVEGGSTSFSEVWVRVPLKRLAGYAVLNIYLPTLVLLVVNYLTLFFRPNIFDVRMMAALTVQLVIATLFSQVSASLPKTSYFKMVDWWLIFCIGITFLTIIFHVLVDASLHAVVSGPMLTAGFQSYEEHKSKRADFMIPGKRGDRMVCLSKLVVAAVFVVFNVIYWIYIFA